jgi:hypothetical protein
MLLLVLLVTKSCAFCEGEVMDELGNFIATFQGVF